LPENHSMKPVTMRRTETSAGLVKAASMRGAKK